VTPRPAGKRRTPADSSQGGSAVLDDMDKQIVRLLQKNARTPNTEIARSLGVTETTIRNRVNRLVEENLIEIVAVVKPSATTDATISAIIHVRVQPRHLQGVATALRGHGEVRYLALTLGEHQIVIEAFFRDHRHMLSSELTCSASSAALPEPRRRSWSRWTSCRTSGSSDADPGPGVESEWDFGRVDVVISCCHDSTDHGAPPR